MAYSTNTWYLNAGNSSSTRYYAVPVWAATTSFVAGSLVRQLTTPTVGNERVFVQITSATHTTSSVEPTWTVTKGAKNINGTTTWQECTGQPGVNGDITNSPIWTVSSTPPLGLIIYDSTSGALQICSTSGAGGTGSKPTFSATAGTTTTDASATWTSLGAASNFGIWAAPFARLQSCFVANFVTVAGSTIYAGADHAETQAAAMSFTTLATVNILSVPAATIPPTTLQSGASVTTTGSNSLTIVNVALSFIYINGFTFSAGTGATTVGTIFGATTSYGSSHLTNCTIVKPGTSTGNIVQSYGYNVWDNVSFQAGAVGDNIFAGYGGDGLLIKNSPSLIAGATIPNAGFLNGALSTITLRGCDLSPLGSNALYSGTLSNTAAFNIVNCKLGSGWTLAATPSNRGSRINVVNSDSGATNYIFQTTDDLGTMSSETTVIMTGGSSNGTVGYAAKIITVAAATWQMPFASFPLTQFNTTLSTNRTVSIFGIWNSASLPNNDQFWIQAEYPGSASTPISSFASSTKANILASGSALSAATTKAWDSQGPVRANSTTYSIGNSFTVASAPGQRFWVTAGSGSTAASPPAGYASAADGSNVTDGGFTVLAGVRFVASVTLSSPQPAQAGPIYVVVYAGIASSTFYFDPTILLG